MNVAAASGDRHTKATSAAAASIGGAGWIGGRRRIGAIFSAGRMWIGPSHESAIVNGKPVHRDIPGHFSEGHPSMPTKRRTTRKPEHAKGFTEQQRAEQRKALRRQVRDEREIQALTRRLAREVRKSDDALANIGAQLVSRARAAMVERDVDLSLETPST